MTQAELFATGMGAVTRVMNRVVRRCCLLGVEPVTDKNCDHSKTSDESPLQRSPEGMGLTCCGLPACQTIEFYRGSHPDVVAASDIPKIARWWLLIWPAQKNSAGNLKKPHEFELDAIWNHRQKLEIGPPSRRSQGRKDQPSPPTATRI